MALRIPNPFGKRKSTQNQSRPSKSVKKDQENMPVLADTKFVKKDQENIPVLAINKITSADTTIESTEIIKRIIELEYVRTVAYTIKQNRANDKDSLFTDNRFNSREAAFDWLDDRDYLATRFTVVAEQATGLSDDNQRELAQLRELNRAGRSAFGSLRWATGVRLYTDEYFTEEWTRDQVVQLLRISASQLDAWPLSLIDWLNAAQERLDDKYTLVRFNNVPFWGSTTAE